MTTPEKDNCSSSSSSHYALHVALQTMKERCQNLQKRLSTLEEENLSLRMAQSSVQQPSGLSSAETITERRVSNQTELDVLREKVSELSRQKIQLMDHISMVAAENRQLWSRLSKLTKDNQSLGGIDRSFERCNARCWCGRMFAAPDSVEDFYEERPKSETAR